jgi:hypothetical protein
MCPRGEKKEKKSSHGCKKGALAIGGGNAAAMAIVARTLICDHWNYAI